MRRTVVRCDLVLQRHLSQKTTAFVFVTRLMEIYTGCVGIKKFSCGICNSPFKGFVLLTAFDCRP